MGKIRNQEKERITCFIDLFFFKKKLQNKLENKEGF